MATGESMPKPGPKLKKLPVPERVFWDQPKPCDSCGADMWFWKNPTTGAWVPVNADSTSHFLTCNDPKRFSRKGGDMPKAKLKEVDGKRALETDVRHCARCGGDHKKLAFLKLQRPAKEWQWWVLCPTTGEPILMNVSNVVEGG